MALPDDLKLQEESSNLGGIPGMANNSPSDFEYIPAKEYFTTPMSEEFDKALDPELQKTIDGWADNVNRFAIQPVGNINTPFPTEATDTYNPQAQQTPADLTTPEGSQRALDNLINNPVGLSEFGEEKPLIADPIYASRKASRFDRYYNHPSFGELGYHPYADNETFYNANSTIFDDMSRMIGVWGSQVGSGFMSNYRSIGDLSEDVNYFTNPDLTTALEFEEALDIGMSSREGGLAFANNLLLQTGYTVGIISSIAIEEMALLGLEAITFGGASPLVAAKTAVNVGKLGRAIANTFDITRLAKASRNMLKTFNQVDNARDFWASTKAGRQFATNLFIPETAHAFRNLKTMQHAGQNLTNLGKGAKVFGSFYKDLRALNIALAESKLEAGMVYNQQLANGMASYEARGLEVDAEAMGKIKNSAAEASFHTAIRNAPLIFFTNQFVLGNALPGFNRTMTRVMGDSVKGAGKRIIKTSKTIGKDGKIVRNVFKKADTGLKGFGQRIAAAGARGSIKGIGQASLRYFSANVSEGIQELGQEAIAVGTKNYWTGILEDPMAGGIELHRAAVASAVDSQMSGQGFETFMSGFLMGGIVQTPQKLFFQTAPKLYAQRSAKSREDYKTYKDQREKLIDNIVETHNNAWNRMADSMDNTMWDPTKLDFLVQKEVKADMEKAVQEDNLFDFIDAKDFGKFHHMATIFENGTSGLFRGQINDLLQLTDEELAQAFPNSPKSEIKSGKIRERLSDMIVTMDKFETRYNKHKNDYKNPFNENDFKPGSRDYVDEKLKKQAYEHARYLTLFTGTQFDRALERADSIYNQLASDPILSKIAANDLTVLLDLNAIDKEMNLLVQEVATIEDEKLKKEKTERLKRLAGIREVLYAEENLNKDGTLRKSKSSTKEQKIKTLEKERDQKLNEIIEGESKTQAARRKNAIKKEYAEKIKAVTEGKKTDRIDYPLAKLRKALKAYVDHLAETKGDFVDNDRIEDVLKLIVDYKALKGRAVTYYKAIEYLANPARLDEIAERQYEQFKVMLKGSKEQYRKLVDSYILTVEQNALLNALSNLTPSVFPDVEEAKLFLETGNVDALRNFFTEEDYVDPNGYPELYGQIQEALSTYRQAVQREDETKKEEEDTVSKKESEDAMDEVLDNLDLEDSPTNNTFTSKKNENPEVKKLLARMFAKYQNEQANLGKTSVKWDTWLKSKDAQLINKAYEGLKKIWWKETLSKKTDAQAATVEYNNDTGFVNWLKTQEENPNVATLLDEAGLNFKSFDEVQTDIDDVDTGNLADIGKPIKRGVNYVVVERTYLKDDGTPGVFYSVLNKDGSDLSDKILNAYKIKQNGRFTVKKEATNTLDKLEKNVKSSDSFDLFGESFSYGNIITDKKGNRYVVLSTPTMAAKYNNLMIVPENLIEKKGTPEFKDGKVYITEEEFKSLYNKEDINFRTLPNNVARLRADEAIKAYPYRNDNRSEERSSAQERFDAIMSMLSPEEISKLEIVITDALEGGNIGAQFNYDENTEPNPYIKRRTETYSIAIRVTDPQLLQKMNTELENRRIRVIEAESNGIIAFIPNMDTVIFDKDGSAIDPRFIDIDLAKDTFFKYNFQTDQAFLETIRTGYAMQYAFMNYIQGKKKAGEPLTLNITELRKDGFDILPSSTYSNKTAPKSPKELAYNTVDGNVVILDSRRFYYNGKLVRNEQFITDIADPQEKLKFERALKEDMIAKGLYQTARDRGAYVLVIKDSYGQYTFTDLKGAQLDVTGRVQYFKKIIDRAKDTIDNNLEVTNENYSTAPYKDKAYNVEFNKELSNDIYIATTPGYSIDLSVNLAGKIQLQIFDNVSGKPLFVNEKGQRSPASIGQKQVLELAESGQFALLEDLVIEAVNNDDRAKAAKVKLDKTSFRTSFPADASANFVLDNTETTLDDRVRYDYKLRLNGQSDFTQAVKDVPAQTSTNAQQKQDDSSAEIDELQNLANLATKSQEVENQSDVDYFTRKKELEGLIKARNLEIAREWKELSKEAKKKNKLKDLKAKDSVLQGYQTELNNLIKSANKIVDPALTFTDTETIEAFVEWAKNTLPDFITVQDIRTLGNNLMAGGVRVGAFALNLNGIAGGLNIGGTIYTGANNPYKYHEAFHSVFRLLLTDEEISRYLGIAKKEVRAVLRSQEGYEVLPGVFTKSLAEAKEILRNSADTYSDMSDSRLEQELYEEYMANRFEDFKKDRKQTKTSSEIKSLFNRIIEWIKSFFTSYTKNELNTLFENIDAGKFKSNEAVVNRFTESQVKGVTVANALIPFQKVEGSTTEGFLYLNGEQSNRLVNNIAAAFVNRQSKNTDTKKTAVELLDETIKDFAFLYSTENEINFDLTEDQLDALSDYEAAFENFSDDIAEAVATTLELVDISIEDKLFVLEEQEDEVGLRETGQYDKSAELVGGASSISSRLRKYIMTTSLPISETDAGADIFGHTELTEGEPLIKAVDFAVVYNGLLKATANTTDPRQMLQKMYLFAQNNPETRAVVLKFFNDLGIVNLNLLSLTEADANDVLAGLLSNIYNIEDLVTDPLFFQAMLKGFQNFKVDYVFIHRSLGGGKTYTYSAANRDDTRNQLDIWGQHYSSIYMDRLTKDPKAKQAAIEALENMNAYFSGTELTFGNKNQPGISDKRLNDIAAELADDLRATLGIALSPQYIAYNIISRMAPSNLTPTQAIIKNTNENVRLIQADDLTTFINLIKIDNDLFSENEEGSFTRLRQLAIGNSSFDETIGVSVFKNAAGDLVYAHQLPTYHLTAINELNSREKLDELRENAFLVNNLLLNSDGFNQLSEEDKLKVTRISGGKEGNIDVSDEGIEESRSTGKTYGDFTAKEFILSIVNAYTSQFNDTNGKLNNLIALDEDGKQAYQAVAPVLIRVIEASNTGDLTNLPVIKAIEKSGTTIKLTDEAIQGFINNIKAEFERIRKELNPETATYKADGSGRLIAGYNADNVGLSYNPEGRAFTFFETGSILKDVESIDGFKKDVVAQTSNAQISRIKSGDQKALVYNAENAKKFLFTRDKETRTARITTKEDKNRVGGVVVNLYNRGLTTVTLDNRKEIFDLFAGSIFNVDNKPETATHKFTINGIEYYVESGDFSKFLQGRKELYLYDIVGEAQDQTETLQEATAASTQTAEPIESKPVINIYWGGKNANKPENHPERILSNLAERKFTWEGREYGSVEHAYQSNKSGEFDQSTYDKYVKKGGYGVKIRGKAVTKGFDNLQLMKDLVVESFAQNPKQAALLLNYSDFTHTTNEVIDQAFLDGIRLAQSDAIIANAEGAAAEGMMLDFQQTNYENILKQALADNIDVTFEEAIGNMDKFKDFLQFRLEKEYQQFRTLIDQEVGKDKDFSDEVRNGLKNKSGQQTPETLISAKQLNLTEDINFNLRQIFFNNWLNTTAINQLLLGDQALSLKDSVDAVKRAKMQNAAGYGADTIIKAPEYGVNHAVERMDVFLYEDPKAPSAFSKADIEVSDGQLYMTTKAFRYMWFGFGKLTPTQARLLDKVEAGENIPYEDLLGAADKSTENYAKMKAMINSKKLVYGDGQVFLKMSAFTLTKNHTSKKVNGQWVPKTPGMEHLHNMREKMEAYEKKMFEQGIGTLALAAPTSASKMMKYNVNTLEFMGDKSELTPDNAMQLTAKHMKLQVINPSNKLTITEPTQMKSLVTSEHENSTPVILNGKPTTVGAIREEYNKALIQRGNLKYTNKRNLIYSFDPLYASELFKESIKVGELSPDLFVYLQYASEGLKASQATSNILEMFSTDENGNQKYNLNNPQTVRKFEELFMSFFSKGVFSEKTTGMSVALVSDFGTGVFRRVFSVDENNLPDKHEIIRMDVYNKMENPPEVMFNINNGKVIGSDENLDGLAAAVEKAGSKGVVIFDRLRSNMKEYNAEGEYTQQRYSEAMIPAHYTNVGNEIANTDKAIPDAVGKMFGVRIPSQDNHSTINIKQVDFLSGEYGSSGIFPRELVEVSGADFDIDKLYIHTKNFYEENGEFFEYGKAETEQGQYEDYVRYVKESVNKPGSDIADAHLKYKHAGAAVGLTFSQAKNARKTFGRKALQALSATGLPITKEQYLEHKAKYGEPYAWAIDNLTLDQKFALMQNESNAVAKDGGVGLSNQPADLEPLTELFKELSNEETGLEYFKKFAKNEGINVNSIYGQALAFKNNKEGAANIGAVVLPNLVVNLLQEYKVTIEDVSGQTPVLNLNNEIFDKFETLNEIKPDGTKGYRTQYIISSLITAMTDNAKERLAAKLGLNRDALAVVTSMTALGVPIKTSILMVNNPKIRQLYYNAINKVDPKEPGISKLLDTAIGQLQVELDEAGFNQKPKVNDKLLASQLETPAEERDTPEYMAETLATLQQFRIAWDIKDYIGNIREIMNLSSSVGRDIDAVKSKMEAVEKLGLNLSEDGYKKYREERASKSKPLIDVRKIIKGTWQGANLERLIEFNNKILPSVFLSETKSFKDIFNKVSANVIHSKRLETEKKLSLDLISYLTIKAYQYKELQIEGANRSRDISTLSNSILYDQIEGRKITDIIKSLKAADNNNFFLKKFVILQEANDINNKTGFNNANSNTFSKLNDSAKVELQTSFARLYGNLDTRADATAIIHYIMLKDGLQFGYQSLLDAITPFTYDAFLSQIDTVHAAFKDVNKTDAIFKSTFGLTYNELVDEFTKGYLESGMVAKRTDYLLVKYAGARYTGSPQNVETKAKFSFAEAKKDTDKIFIFSENAQKLGSSGGTVLRGLDNAVGLTVKKDLAKTKESYYTDNDITEFATLLSEFESSLREKITEGKTLVFQSSFLSKAELEQLSKKAPQIYNELSGMLSKFGYDLASSKLSGATTNIRQAKNKGAYIDDSGEVAKFIVNLFPGEAIKDTEAEVAVRQTKGKMTDQLKKSMKYKGFPQESTKVNNTFYTQTVFPIVLKLNVGSSRSPIYRWFELSKVQAPVNNGPLAAQTVVRGNYAEYVEVSPKGSRKQSPVGFLGGAQPTTAEVDTFVRQIGQEDLLIPDIDGVDDLLDNLDSVLNEGNPAEQAVQNGASVNATNGNIDINGKNKADITEEDIPESETDNLDLAEGGEFVSQNPEQDIANFEALNNGLLNINTTADESNPGIEQIENFWDEFIENNPDVEVKKDYLAKLRDAKVNSLEELVDKFQDPLQSASAEEFIDRIKQCIFKI